MLFEVREVIAQPLKTLFSRSIDTGEIPDDWLKADIVALYKKGSRNEVSNYRPVSLTCIICKVLEGFIRDHIMDYFTENKLFSNKQYGFRKKRSTQLQILRILDDWTRAVQEGYQVDAIYTDFEKAFDKVPHNRLLQKLRSYNIDKDIINWIQSFLINRKQRVKVNGKYSNWESVISGIPQGTILGPILFIIYINDLPDKVEGRAMMSLYADDAKLYRTIKTRNDSQELQMALNGVKDWCDKWLLKLNVNKCKYLTIHGKKAITDTAYGLMTIAGRQELERVSKIKDLGILIDEKLNFSDHLNEKVNKAYMMIGIIKRNFKYLEKDAFINLYKAMVRSHLEYAVSVWSPRYKKDIEIVEKIQRRATKLVRECKGKPYKDRLRYLNLPTLKYRRLRGDMLETYKILNDIYDNEAAPVLELSGTRMTRGNDKKLNKVMCKTDLRRHFFTQRVVDVWNSLPSEIINSASVNIFKNKLDKFWQTQEIFFDYKADIAGTGSRSWI